MTEKKDTAPAVQKSKFEISKQLVDSVANKVATFVKEGQLDLPKDYSPENAMKSAWLVLQETVDKAKRPVLETCTQASIANSLLSMVVQGLNVGKKQGYFIAYGNTLTFFRSYFGSMAVTRTVAPEVVEFAFAVVYKGDTFKYSINKGKKEVNEHVQDLSNVDKENIIGAYCIALDKDGNSIRTEIMTFEEIKQSWKQSILKPVNEKGEVRPDSTHGKFTADMALRTVINKVCKYIVNASSDKTILLDAFNHGLDEVDEAEAAAEIEMNANTGDVIEIPHEEEVPDEAPDETPEKPTGDNRPIGAPKDGKLGPDF